MSQNETGGLSHIDEKGRARMVDVAEKPERARLAVARGRVVLLASTLPRILSGNLFPARMAVHLQPAFDEFAAALKQHAERVG